VPEWRMIDADGHIREIESDVFEYLPENYQNRRDAVLYFPLLPHHGWHRQAGSGGMGGSFLIPTLEDWQKALDQTNMEAAVIYPSRFMHIGQVGMVEFAVDLSRAYNDYLYDRFLRHESRLKGIAVLPLQDIPAAIAELRRAVKTYGWWEGFCPLTDCPGRWVIRIFTRSIRKPVAWVACSRSMRKILYATTICFSGAMRRPLWPTSGRRCASSPI